MRRAVAAAPLAGLVLLLFAWMSRFWLLAPGSGAQEHHLATWAKWHGRLMMLGWGTLIPLGILAARFLKVWPGQDWPRVLDNRRWWHAHRSLQWVGILAATVALALAWPHARWATPLAWVHAMAGFAIMALGWSQVVWGHMRGSKGGPTDLRLPVEGGRGDHYFMSRRRRLFEHYHKRAGYVAVALVLVTVPIGLLLADAPRWMWFAIVGWWLTLGGSAVALQRRGWCIDTYHAIWGPDPDLPGNRMRPIGRGISRDVAARRGGGPKC